MNACIEMSWSPLERAFGFDRNSCVIMQVGESLCIDPKILQAVSDTLKEALGKKSYLVFDYEGVRHA
jgi:hypothetical protein